MSLSAATPPEQAPPEHDAGCAGGVDVSFLVAARDVAPFIAAAVGSALAQRGCTLEVIVVDDGSTDGTAEIVRALSLRDGRVKLLRGGPAEGASAARNRALGVARGTWVAVLDGDDEIRPDRTRALIDAATLHAADIVADNLVRFGHAIRGAPTALPRGPHPYGIDLGTAEYLRRNHLLRAGTNLGYLKPMFRRSFLARHGLTYDESLRIGEDFQFCLSALAAGAKYHVTSDAFYLYRVRPGSLSWRIGVDDVDALEAACSRLRPRIMRASDPELDTALQGYVRSLALARALLQVIEQAKAGRLAAALRVAAVRPRAWRLLVPATAGVLTRLALRRIAGAVP